MISPSPPQETAAKKRRKALNKTWRSPSWKKAVKEFIGDRPCEWCGSMEYRTAHHPYRSTYGKDIYLDLVLSNAMVLCRRCHSALHKGLKLCPVCKKRYAPNEAECCFSCYCEQYPEAKERVERAKVERRKLQREARKKQAEKVKEWKKKNGGK